MQCPEFRGRQFLHDGLCCLAQTSMDYHLQRYAYLQVLSVVLEVLGFQVDENCVVVHLDGTDDFGTLAIELKQPVVLINLLGYLSLEHSDFLRSCELRR